MHVWPSIPLLYTSEAASGEQNWEYDLPVISPKGNTTLLYPLGGSPQYLHDIIILIHLYYDQDDISCIAKLDHEDKQLMALREATSFLVFIWEQRAWNLLDHDGMRRRVPSEQK